MPVYPPRVSKSRIGKQTLWRIIRRKCLDCSNGQPKEVRFCPVTSCPLWNYRFGRDVGHELEQTDAPKNVTRKIVHQPKKAA